MKKAYSTIKIVSGLLAAVFLLASRAQASAPTLGQWIWTPQDLKLFEESRKLRPDLKAGVWAGTVFWNHGHFQIKLAMSPARVESPVVVVRLDDSVHLAWNDDNSKVSEKLNEALVTLLHHIEGTGLRPEVIQLDYDCPVSHLKDWAEAMTALKKDALKDRDVWITSLVSHLNTPDFGRLFQGLVAGHILQVFDTGDAYGDGKTARLLRDLERQALPFQMGFGAFERKSPSGVQTQHREWMRDLPLFSRSPLYRGAWIFPAGRSWIAQIRGV